MLNLTAHAQVNDALNEYLAALEQELGQELLAVYLLGSLSTNSYAPGWSDVNGVIVAKPGAPAHLGARAEAVKQAILAVHSDWRKLLFSRCIPVGALENTTWKNHPEGWGLIDATNLIEDGVLIWGQDVREKFERPNLEALRAYIIWELIQVLRSSSPLPARAPRGSEWNRLDPLAIVNWLVYPARVLLAWDKGRVGSKTEAVNHYIEEYHGPWEPVLLQADTLRRAGSPDLLTPEILAAFASQTPGLFEWTVKRLLAILFLPGDLAQAAHHLGRWLDQGASPPTPQSGAPYATFVAGSLGERARADQAGQAPDVFVPRRKPWLNKP